MAFHDLREYITAAKQQGDLVRVTDEISPHLELGFVAKELARQEGPAALFEHVGGASSPVLCNLFPTRRRIAEALSVPSQLLRDRWLHAVEHPVAPTIVDDGPCQEVVVDRDVDIRRLIPQVVWHPEDGGPYITLGCSITHDPRRASATSASIASR